MPKYKVTVVYTGEVEVEIEADTKKDAEILSTAACEELSPIELERNIVELRANAEESDEDEDDLMENHPQ